MQESTDMNSSDLNNLKPARSSQAHEDMMDGNKGQFPVTLTCTTKKNLTSRTFGCCVIFKSKQIIIFKFYNFIFSLQ